MIGSGAYIVVIAGKTRVVYARPAMDGGMVEFLDATTWEPAGCAGINWWKEPGHAVPFGGVLPKVPGGQWL